MDNPNTQADKPSDDNSKKTSFDEMSKEELIKKCKGLLVIAQKAKQTKTELNNEMSALRDKQEKLEMQRSADKESLKTMRELLDTLTEQKLSLTTEMDGVKQQNARLRGEVEKREGEVRRCVEGHEEIMAKLKGDIQVALGDVSQMDTEITSLKRQKTRLERENEEVMEQMTEFENRIKVLTDEGQEQRKRISELEKLTECVEGNQVNSSRNVTENTVQELDTYRSNLDKAIRENSEMAKELESVKASLQSKCSGISKLETELNSIKSQLDSKITALADAENRLAQKDQTLLENVKNLEAERLKKEKLNAKLKQYRDKIVKCASSITQLKNTKFILLKTVSEYSESVPKWSKDIVNASKLLTDQLLQLEDENNQLKEKVSKLEKSSDDVDSKDHQNDKFELLVKERDELLSQLKDLKHKNESVLLNIQDLESEKLILINEKKSARGVIHKHEAEKVELQNNCQELSARIESLNADIKKLNEQLDRVSTEKDCLVNDLDSMKQASVETENTIINDLREEVTNLKLSLVTVEEENKLLKEANEMLKLKVEEMTSSVDEINPAIMEQNSILQADISKLETKIAAYKTENASLLFEMKESQQRMKEMDDALKELEDVKLKLGTYKSENMELLNEMKEINQVLKERGETISKQDMEITEGNRKVKHLEDELKKANEDLKSKDQEIKTINDKLLEKESRLKMVGEHKEGVDKSSFDALEMERDNLKSLLDERDSIIVSLNEDINRFKKNQGSICCDAPSENMSISTTSKVEEASRLKDLDESLEERYAKLRMLAVKLKKRVGELTIQVKNLEEDKSVLEGEKNKLVAKLEGTGTVSKNIQTIQSEYDKLADKLEVCEKELKAKDKLCQEHKDKVAKLDKELLDSRESYGKLEKEVEFMKKEHSASDMVVKEYQTQVTSLKKDCEVLKQKDLEITQLKGDLASKEERLSAEMTAHQSTREALEKAKRDVKKKSVLSLEMEDYERSMKDLTNKMDDNKKKIVQMESTIDTQEGTIQSLRTQIKMLEDQLNTEEKIVRETKELLHIATEDLKERDININSKLEEISQLEKKLEETNQTIEDLNIQLATALGEKEKVALKLGQEKMDLNTRLKRCEELCSELENTLKLREIELEDIKAEFAGYKVRAQNVLRQNQTKDVSVEENLKEEMTALKAELDSLRPELQATKEELESVMSDRGRLATRCSELQSALQTERELANTQIQRDQHEYNSLKLQMSTLTQCYKKQLSDLEERTSDEIGNLRKELEFSRISLERANALTKDQALALEKRRGGQFSGSVIVTPGVDPSSGNANGHLSDVNDNSGDINVALLEREEGEGSESTPSPSPTYMSRSTTLPPYHHQPPSRGGIEGGKRREPVPLDQLLEGGVPEEEDYSQGDVETRLERALRQIEFQEKRLAHMTEIIAEAEKEVARRTQLGEALKEEVRRCERQLERSLHHHNQEYLKNVMVKFLTLGPGDERGRLVPVLHTILTLSPEETNQLTAVAKGTDPNSNKGWGSYIPWSGKS